MYRSLVYPVAESNRIFNDPVYGQYTVIGKVINMDKYNGQDESSEYMINFCGPNRGKAYILGGSHPLGYSTILDQRYGIPGNYGFDPNNYMHQIIEGTWSDLVEKYTLFNDYTLIGVLSCFEEFFKFASSLPVPQDNHGECYNLIIDGIKVNPATYEVYLDNNAGSCRWVTAGEYYEYRQAMDQLQHA